MSELPAEPPSGDAVEVSTRPWQRRLWSTLLVGFVTAAALSLVVGVIAILSHIDVSRILGRLLFPDRAQVAFSAAQRRGTLTGLSAEVAESLPRADAAAVRPEADAALHVPEPADASAPDVLASDERPHPPNVTHAPEATPETPAGGGDQRSPVSEPQEPGTEDQPPPSRPNPLAPLRVSTTPAAPAPTATAVGTAPTPTASATTTSEQTPATTSSSPAATTSVPPTASAGAATTPGATPSTTATTSPGPTDGPTASPTPSPTRTGPGNSENAPGHNKDENGNPTGNGGGNNRIAAPLSQAALLPDRRRTR